MTTVVRGIEQGTPQWRELRRGIVTASNFGKLLTGSTLKKSAQQREYLAQLLVDYHTPEQVPDIVTRDMERGLEMEAEALAMYELESGQRVERVSFVYADKSCLWGCSPDGLISEDGGLEVKAPTATTHIGYQLASAGIPPNYIPQVFGNLLCTDRDWWDFMSYCPPYAPYIMRLYAIDPTYLKWRKAFEPVLKDFLDELVVMRRRFDPNQWASAA